jgi:serine/threonine-protein kinase
LPGAAQSAYAAGVDDRAAKGSTSRGDPTDPLIGRTFASYKVLRKIGRGGMGAVYLAEHPRIGKQVAIKVLHKELATNPAVVERFFREARLVNDIRHEHIIDVIDFGEDPSGAPYLIMEVLVGESLEERLARGKLDESEARQIGAQVARALAAAHQLKVVHRDLKPGNIHLCQRAESSTYVKLLDFGIAKLTTGEGGTKLTATGMVVGTPVYMAPEQIEGHPVGPAADLYALGCILFEMVTGQPPFGGSSVTALMKGHLLEPPRRPRQLNPQISESYEAITLTCLAKDAAGRHDSATDLAAALEGHAQPHMAARMQRAVAAAAPPRSGASQEAIAVGPTLLDSARQPAPAAMTDSGTSATAPDLPARSKRGADADAEAPPAPRGAGRWIGVAALLLVVAGGAGAYMMMRTPPPPEVTSVPLAAPSAAVPTPPPTTAAPPARPVTAPPPAPAAAAVAAAVPPPGPAPPAAPSLEDRLANLESLCRKKIMKPAECQREAARIRREAIEQLTR